MRTVIMLVVAFATMVHGAAVYGGMDTQAEMDRIVSTVRSNPDRDIDISELMKGNPKEILSAMDRHLNTSSGVLKWRMSGMLGTLAKQVDTAESRKAIAHRLLLLFMNGERFAQRHLSSQFSEGELASADKTAFTEYFYDKAWPEKIHRNEALLLFTTLGLESELPRLKELFDSTKWPADGRSWNRTLKWTFRRVLARLGDKESIDYCIGKIDDEPDLRTKAVAILDLDLLKTPAVVPCLRKALDSKEIVEEPHHRVPLANYAAKSLSRLLDGFPGPESKYGVYAAGDIAKCRKWMDEQAEWKFKEF